MTKYRKKPVEIEAWPIQSLLEVASIDINSLPARVLDAVKDDVLEFKEGRIVIATLEGVMVGMAVDVLIQGVEGEFYPCARGIFDKTYEEVE